MVKIKIGSEERNIEDADPSWINQQINRRRKDEPICVWVRIQTDSLDFTLATPGCRGGGGRKPKPSEQKIFDLWKKHKLDEADFPSGHLVAFIKQLQRLL